MPLGASWGFWLLLGAEGSKFCSGSSSGLSSWSFLGGLMDCIGGVLGSLGLVLGSIVSHVGGARGGFLGHLEATESPNDENSNIPQTVRQINVLASWASLGRALVSFFWGEGGRSWKPFGPCGRHIGPSWRQPLTAWEGSPRRYGSFGELEGCAWPSRKYPGAEVAQSQL